MAEPRGRILNVDDYVPARYARSEVLRRAGYEVIEAGTGAEALRIVAEERPDLVLLDINLPDLSGFEVLERLKRDAATAEIPVVVVTSRVLTVPEREEIMRRAVLIVGKGSLESTDFEDVIRRATKSGILPVIES